MAASRETGEKGPASTCNASPSTIRGLSTNMLDSSKLTKLLPPFLALLGLGAGVLWFASGPGKPLQLRIPGTDHAPGNEAGTNANAVLAGKLIRGEGRPANLLGSWPQFRGPNRDGISQDQATLSRDWQSAGPRELWSVELGEGYAGAAIRDGRVYVMDYDQQKREDALRCLSLADGREIWRFAYPVRVKRNHGMSRTTPTVTSNLCIAMGPKCHVVCLDPTSGELRWGLDLVRQFGATVPPVVRGTVPAHRQWFSDSSARGEGSIAGCA